MCRPAHRPTFAPELRLADDVRTWAGPAALCTAAVPSSSPAEVPTRSLARRLGRPSLPPARRRCFRLLLRLTAAELATVRWRAARARLPAAVYARAASLRAGSPPGPVPALNIFFVGQLGRLANNLNQLTKLAHQGRTSPLLLPCLEAILVEVRTLRRALIGLDKVGDPAGGLGVDPGGGGEPGLDAGS
jgi:hypothetical protein